MNNIYPKVQFDKGNRVEISHAPSQVLHGGVSDFVPSPRTIITFKETLDKKCTEYVKRSITCGQMYRICEIGRLMNEFNISFKKAARKYFLLLKS